MNVHWVCEVLANVTVGFGFLHALLVLQIRMLIQGFSRQRPQGTCNYSCILSALQQLPTCERDSLFELPHNVMSHARNKLVSALSVTIWSGMIIVSSFMGYQVSFQCSLFGARFKSHISEQRGTGALLVLCRPSSLSDISPDPVLHPPLLASRGGLIEGPGHVACFSILSFWPDHTIYYLIQVCVFTFPLTL